MAESSKMEMDCAVPLSRIFKLFLIALVMMSYSQTSSQSTDQPSAIPVGQSSPQPTPSQTTAKPSAQPTSQPTGQTTAKPSAQPTPKPTGQPTSKPTAQPTSKPTGQPTAKPTGQPTGQPTAKPTGQPTAKPSAQPTGQPTGKPSAQPTSKPTAQLSASPITRVSRSPSQTSSFSSVLFPTDQTDTSPLLPVSDGPSIDFYPLEFGDHVFSAIVLVLCAGISTHLCFGYSTKQSKETFIGLILLLMLGFQLFHLIRAALYIPASVFSVYNPQLLRTDCLESLKGGKKPFKSTQTVDRNPCFCIHPSSCIIQGTNQRIDLSNGGICPVDGSALCLAASNNNTKISPYISHFRNCIGGQGPSCTRDQPCFPCSRNTLQDWSGSGKSFGIARCRACSTEFTGNCNFIPEVGPYCYVRVGSKEVAPCTKCCTEPTPLIVNGTCY